MSNRIRPIRNFLIAAVVVCLPAALAVDAQARPSAEAVTQVAETGCLPTKDSPRVPKYRKRMIHDHTAVSAAELRALRARSAMHQVRTWTSGRAVALPDTVRIPVRVHVIRGKHRGERGPSRPAVRQLIGILNGGFAGEQSPASTPTRFRFALKSIRYTKNDRWYHAYNYNRADSRAKRVLHRGDRRTLNLYINGAGTQQQPVLGWSRLPWQLAGGKRALRLDGVSVNVAAMPGGSASNYNLGDTVIHEVGHWLGLLHPWQGGCTEPNDGVADTPQEAGPSYYCDDTADTCPNSPGLDPIHNFMDYSYDICLNQFTPGQVARMDQAWAEWRA